MKSAGESLTDEKSKEEPSEEPKAAAEPHEEEKKEEEKKEDASEVESNWAGLTWAQEEICTWNTEERSSAKFFEL
ncbi:unnamed protein product [Dibothriocephalus latus]|uniref:Uncharacterized protein n=1 Tax=Dibothriocephalus latus TaxID=60516 RepID=A0A3P7MFQ0_DIBLA|nr:unnamed protein product [Dibothriocephalus latus]